jgi:hypothetical protein
MNFFDFICQLFAYSFTIITTVNEECFSPKHLRIKKKRGAFTLNHPVSMTSQGCKRHRVEHQRYNVAKKDSVKFGRTNYIGNFAKNTDIK